ncbi:MAG: hypothetical protein IJ870_05260 [Alphaproteobacteria bacterium]|nr:hypothetical protein [Alphaproteobacteria bacterium]
MEKIKLSEKDCEIMRATDTITCEDVRDLMQNLLADGKIGTVKLGELRIENHFIPELKETPLFSLEGDIVFYAVQKMSHGWFQKADKKICIYCALRDEVYIVPPEAVCFCSLKEGNLLGESLECLISRTGEEHPVCKCYSGKKEHVCFFEKMEVWRRFEIHKEGLICTADILKQHFRWSEPDPWAAEHFTITDTKDPLFFLRHEPQEIPGWSVRISYPSQPAMWGWEIDE